MACGFDPHEGYTSQDGEVVSRLAHNQEIGGANPSPAISPVCWEAAKIARCSSGDFINNSSTNNAEYTNGKWSGSEPVYRGSNPCSASKASYALKTRVERSRKRAVWEAEKDASVPVRARLCAALAQLAEATGLSPVQCGFESHERYTGRSSNWSEGSLRFCDPSDHIRYMPYKDVEKRREASRKDQARRREIVRDIIFKAKNKPCEDCNIQYPYYVMEFDHARGDKEYAISKVVTRPTNKAIQDLPAELEKCDVVCSNCHRIRHKGVTFDWVGQIIG